LAINYVTEKLELDPLTANAIMLAVGGAIDGAQDGDILKGITDAYANALLNATSFGVARLDPETGQIQIAQGSSWQEAAYISRVLDITNSLKENGLEQTLYDYSASVLHCEAVNGFTRPGGVYDILGEHLSGLGDVAFEIIDKLNGVKEIKNTETGKTIGQYKEDGDTKVLETGEYETDPETGEKKLVNGREVQTIGNKVATIEVENGKQTSITVLNKDTGDVGKIESINDNGIDKDNYHATIIPEEGESAYEKTTEGGIVVEGDPGAKGNLDSEKEKFRRFLKEKAIEEALDYDWEEQYFGGPNDNDDNDRVMDLESLLFRILQDPGQRIEIVLPGQKLFPM